MGNLPVVLISGCSTGIGRELALEFARAGNRVYATARNPESVRDLAGESIHILALDVTDASSIRECVAAVLRAEGRIDVLVNNAGFGLMGPAIELGLDDLRRQLETNVIGVVALSQAVVPAMLENGKGMIVNMSSVSGVLTSAFAGAYCASKAALNALSDAMRMELAPFGIRVVTAQPGAIKSNFGATAAQDLSRYRRKESRYAPIAERIEYRARLSQESPTGADDFARILVRKLAAKNPPAVVRIGRESFKLPFFRWALPQRLIDRVNAKKFGLDRLE